MQCIIWIFWFYLRSMIWAKCLNSCTDCHDIWYNHSPFPHRFHSYFHSLPCMFPHVWVNDRFNSFPAPLMFSTTQWMCFHCGERASLGKASTVPALGVWLIDPVWLEMVSWLTASVLHLSSLTLGNTWWVSQCVCATKSVREWMIHTSRQTKLNRSCTHTREQTPDSKCRNDFSHLGVLLVFHSFFTRVSFATPDSAVTHFLNLPG